MLGVALFATGDRDGAAAALQKAADLDPGRAERHGNLGTVYLSMGRVSEALREYELQAIIAGSDARAHADLGAALLAANDVPRATAELLRATDLDPSRASYHSNLGYAYQRAGALPLAIAAYRKALSLDDKLSGAWINLATALARDPRSRGEARAALGKALALDATDPNVKANLEELDALERDPLRTSPRP
jgi:tetratricopeptide (TPR) repeat protein